MKAVSIFILDLQPENINFVMLLDVSNQKCSYAFKVIASDKIQIFLLR